MVRGQAGSYIRSPTPGTWKAALVSFESECKPLGNRWLFSIWIFGNWGGRSSNHSSDGIRFVWRSSLSLWHRKCLTQHTHVFPGISSFTLKHVSKTSFVPIQRRALLACFHVTMHSEGCPPRLPSPFYARALASSQTRWHLSHASPKEEEESVCTAECLQAVYLIFGLSLFQHELNCKHTRVASNRCPSSQAAKCPPRPTRVCVCVRRVAEPA